MGRHGQGHCPHAQATLACGSEGIRVVQATSRCNSHPAAAADSGFCHGIATGTRTPTVAVLLVDVEVASPAEVLDARGGREIPGQAG